MRKNNKKRHIEEHEESWAVSYADLLMVLMSFFIVFFNLESGSGDSKEELVDIISKSFHHEEASQKAGSQKAGDKAPGKIDSLKDLQNEFEGLNLKTTALGKNGTTIREKKKDGIDSLFDKNKKSEIKKMRGLMIELPNDIFPLGSYEINKDIKNKLDGILKKITSYSEKIVIVAIGHADATKIKKGRNKVVNTNFILSSLRASKAVEYIVSKGYDKNWVFGQAVSVENRATRSLTLKIYER